MCEIDVQLYEKLTIILIAWPIIIFIFLPRCKTQML